MRLEHGALHVIEADDHHHTTNVTLDLRKVNPQQSPLVASSFSYRFM